MAQSVTTSDGPISDAQSRMAQSVTISDDPISDGPISDDPISDGPISDGPICVGWSAGCRPAANRFDHVGRADPSLPFSAALMVLTPQMVKPGGASPPVSTIEWSNGYGPFHGQTAFGPFHGQTAFDPFMDCQFMVPGWASPPYRPFHGQKAHFVVKMVKPGWASPRAACVSLPTESAPISMTTTLGEREGGRESV